MKKTLLSVGAALLASTALATTLTLTPEAPTHDLKECPAFQGIKKPFSAITKQNPLTRAEETLSMDFQWGYGVGTYIGLDGGQDLDIWQAIEIPAEIATRYAGATVTAVNFYSGFDMTTMNTKPVNNILSATVHICSDLGSSPKILQSKDVELSKTALAYNHVELDEPFILEEGKGFYAAVVETPVNKNDVYVLVDGEPSDSDYGFHVGATDGKNFQWLDNMAPYYGNLAISITIEGDMLPTDGAELFQAAVPSTTMVGEQIPVMFYVSPDTATPVNSIEVEIGVGGSDSVTIPLTLDGNAGYHEIFGGTIGGPVCNTIGDNQVTITITKVNGKPNTSENISATMPILCQDPEIGYPRTYIVEEATGTWCGWCPAGIVFMEWLKSKYPDVIREAIHGSNGQNAVDKMEVPSALPLLYTYSGFPTLKVNRSLELSPTDMTNAKNSFIDFVDAMDNIPAYAEISEFSYSDWTENSVKATVKMRFAYDLDNTNGRYGISFSVCQDEMGPYLQTNYYSGNGYGAMHGWEKKGQQVPTTYDDVIRELSGGLYGFNAFPKTIEADKEYEFSTIISLSEVSAPGFYLNAIMTENYYGEVIASRQLILGEPNYVDEITSEGQGVEESWLDVNGLRLDAPQGLCIKRTVLSDGSVRYEKAIVRK